MAEHSHPPDSPENAAAPVPNRRERRGRKSAASVPHGGKSAMRHRFNPVATPRQYSTRRRSG